MNEQKSVYEQMDKEALIVEVQHLNNMIANLSNLVGQQQTQLISLDILKQQAEQKAMALGDKVKQMESQFLDLMEQTAAKADNVAELKKKTAKGG